jgi:hypothetical protein
MSTQVEGQIALSDEYTEWRSIPAVGEMADDELAQQERLDALDAIEEERALTIPQQHLVVGVGALAAMDETAFQRNIANLVQGQRRLEELTDKLLIEGQDYGKVPGIKKPFLQKPGAEKLANFYGLAVRFEAMRLVGDGDTAPDLAYHVKSYAHLRDFDGPVVAQGYGEANSWEERYRYRMAKATCPTCHREGMIKGKEDGKLRGKWWCPGREGGCNSTFEPNDPAVNQPGMIENPDPWGLANTLVKMGEKRAHVDVVLRATGTSGFFSQDEDSPSVQQQAGAPVPEATDPEVEAVTGVEVERGGKANKPTPVQIATLSRISKEKDLGPDAIVAAIVRVLGVEAITFPEAADRGAKGRQLLSFINATLTADQLGTVLEHLETGEIPTPQE